MPSTWVCVDASFVVHLLVEHRDAQPRALVAGWQEASTRMAAPTLLFYEVANALHQYVRQGLMSTAVADQALATALALPVQLFGDGPLHVMAAGIARERSLPATYDAHYLALAQVLGADFWTADARLARKVGDAAPYLHLLLQP